MATNTVAKHIANLYLRQEYSDLQIICGGQTLYAHKNIVCPRSGYFERASKNFKEASEPFQFKDRDLLLIQKVLEYLYKGEYKPVLCQTSPGANSAPTAPVTTNTGGSQSKSPNLAEIHLAYFHARLHGEADYFMIDDLKEKTREKFRASLKASQIGFMSYTTPDPSKKRSFSAIVKEVYSENANYEELRPILIEHIMEYLPSYRSSPTQMLDDEFLETIPDFTLDLCRAMLNQRFGKNEAGEPLQSAQPTVFSQSGTPAASSYGGLFGPSYRSNNTLQPSTLGTPTAGGSIQPPRPLFGGSNLFVPSSQPPR